MAVWRSPKDTNAALIIDPLNARRSTWRALVACCHATKQPAFWCPFHLKIPSKTNRNSVVSIADVPSQLNLPSQMSQILVWSTEHWISNHWKTIKLNSKGPVKKSCWTSKRIWLWTIFLPTLYSHCWHQKELSNHIVVIYKS